VIGTLLGPTFAAVGVGASVGIGLAIGTRRLLGSLLFEVRPVEPFTLLAAAGLLFLAAALAVLAPAGRVARLRPMAAIRNE
jgi:ABC-type antimicrobial peptide transport system permease subunit